MCGRYLGRVEEKVAWLFGWDSCSSGHNHSNITRKKLSSYNVNNCLNTCKTIMFIREN
jgi:hypothetical protein